MAANNNSKNENYAYNAVITNIEIYDNKNDVDNLKFISKISGKTINAVYKAESEKHGVVAVKVINKYAYKNVSHIINEIDILHKISKICKEYLLCIHYYAEDNNNIYIVMEYIQGWTLSDVIMKTKVYTKHSVAFTICKLLNAVQLIHTKYNIAHRDIKLENIMFAKPNIIKLIDFGFGCISSISSVSSVSDDIISDKSINNANKCIGYPGTLPFMAPEIILQNVTDYKPSDVWSVGIVIFVLLLKLNNKLDLLNSYDTDVTNYRNSTNTNTNIYPDDYLEQRLQYYMNNITIDDDYKNILFSMIKHDPLKRSTIDQIIIDTRELCKNIK
jgi:serine/threonine protein kinase